MIARFGWSGVQPCGLAVLDMTSVCVSEQTVATLTSLIPCDFFHLEC